MAEHRSATLQLFSTVFRFRKLSISTTFCETLSAGEMSLMIVLNAYKGKIKKESLSICELGRRLNTTQPAVTQLVNRLEAKGLVVREADENDRRSVLVRATQQGFKAFKKEYELTLDAMDEIVARMGDERAEQLFELLGEFAECAQSVIGDKKSK